MHMRVIGAAAAWLAAVPALAQSPKDVTGPFTLTPKIVLCTDLPVPEIPVPRLVVKGAHDPLPRLATATGGQLVINRLPDDGLAAGQKYVTSRLNADPRKFPPPGEGFGGLRVTGIVTIKAVDEINAIADVDFACETIEAGDYLDRYTETSLPSSATSIDVPPDFSDRANLLFGADNRVSAGVGDVTSIDRGTLHGVVQGARYAIYRDKRNDLPLVYLGEAVVLVTSELTSKVMVTKSLDAIQLGDVFVPRRAP